MKYPMIEVTWYDAAGEPRPMSTKAARKMPLHKRRTVGYLITEDNTRIVIAQDWNAENREWENVWVIPAPWSVSRVLGVPAP